MTPRGGPTLDFSLFGRYFLDLAVFYPGAFLCLAPLWEHVKAPRRTAVLTAALVTVICLAAAALCAIFELDSNILLLPTLLAAFWLLRWRVGPEVSVSQTAFLFAVSCVMMAVCTLLSAVLNARAEVGNDAPACLVSTSLIKLGLSAVLCIIFWFTAVQWSRWLLREYRGEAFWQSAWPLPTIYAAFLVFCMPLDPAVVLINRLMIISVLAVSISLLGIFLLLYEMYQVAREYTRSAQLDRENQLLAVESRRYTELRAYMEQTRHLRHDFRQHLHVIAGLTEAGQVDELKNYLHQYESELSEERPTLCANPAVDALAGHYDHEAHGLGVPVDWRLELPRQLAIPEADRFFNVQVLDAWTNTAAVLEAPGAYAIAYSSWEGTLPEGVRRIDIPTRTVWTIARIMLSGPDDLPNVAALQGRMQLMPLSAYPAGLAAAPEGSYSPENDFVPVQKVLAMTPQEFFDTANRLMETDPPAEADAPLLRSLAALSVGPGQQFDASALGPLGGLRWKRLLLQLKSSLRAQAARYSRQMGQWIYYGDPIGNFGTAYDYRTMVALMGLGANTTDIAIYPRTSTDSAGADLTGQKTYTLHFDALPPTVGNGFWSVTAYGEDNFLIDNPISRYCVNDRSGLHRNADGSVDVTLSKDAPEDTTNWLPVSDEKFHLFLRIYKPDWTALDSFPPPVISVK